MRQDISSEFYNSTSPNLDVLSFAGSRSTPWNPERTGDYSVDCATGRFYADELTAWVQLTGYLPLLANVCKAITESNQWGGVEIGFFTRLAGALHSPAGRS